MKKLIIILASLSILFCIFRYTIRVDEYENYRPTKEDSLKVKFLHEYFKKDTINKELIDAIASGSKLTKADAGYRIEA